MCIACALDLFLFVGGPESVLLSFVFQFCFAAWLICSVFFSPVTAVFFLLVIFLLSRMCLSLVFSPPPLLFVSLHSLPPPPPLSARRSMLGRPRGVPVCDPAVIPRRRWPDHPGRDPPATRHQRRPRVSAGIVSCRVVSYRTVPCRIASCRFVP